MFNKLLALAIDVILLTNWSGLRTGIVSVTIAPPCTGSRHERDGEGREGGMHGVWAPSSQPEVCPWSRQLHPAQGHQPSAAPPALQLQPPDELPTYRYLTLHRCTAELLQVHCWVPECVHGRFTPELLPTDFLALEDLFWFLFFFPLPCSFLEQLVVIAEVTKGTGRGSQSLASGNMTAEVSAC